MSLITCKKSRGGGNSLKLGVRSCGLGVGGWSSSGRFGRLFSFILSIALLFGVNSAWAADRTWNGETGGTEDAPLEIYNADSWSPNGLPTTSDKLCFVTTAPTVVTNNLANGATTQISGDWMLKSGEWTFLGPAKFPTLENPANSGNIDVVKKGDWTLTYAMYLGRSGNTMTFTNYGKMTHTPNNRWFQIGNGGNGPCVLENISGDWNVVGKFSVGDACKDTKFIWQSGNISATNPTEPFYIGRSIGTDGKVNVEKNEGDWNLQNGLKFNQGKGTFLHNGGTTTVASGKSTTLAGSSGAVSVLNLNGGTFKTKEIVRGNSGGTATVVFNGGELAANAVSANGLVAAGVSLSAGSLGGTINAGSLAVSIVPAISGDGGMTFKGGGSVTLSAAPTYAGATKVELGTKIIATTADVKNSVLANLVVTGVAADGDYYVFEYSGLSDADLANVTCPGGAEGTTITREGNQIKVHYVAPAVDLGWNGGDAAWATANAWTNATGTAKTWTDGNYAVFNDVSTITLGANAAAVAATFNADATVAAGGGTLTVPAVNVASGVSATIAAPTAGALEKTGAGTLTLGASRDDATTLAEGTLVANAPIGTLVFGTDYPVTFDYCGQTLSTIPASAVGGGDVTLKNGTFGSSINVNMNSGSLRVEGDSTVVNCNEFNVGPSDGSSSASYVQIGGMFNAGWHFRDRCGDFIMTNVTITASKNYEVGSSAAATRGRMILSGGSAFIGGNFNVFNGELEIMNETVEVAGSVNIGYNDNSGLITLKSGGTLTTKVIQKYGTPASATVLFDGGTLKANAENANGLVRNEAILSIQTSANGGTIDAAGYAVTVHREIKNKSGESGAMTYKGGGKVTLTAQPTYTGVTTVEVGTTLVVPAAIAGKKLAFTIPVGLEKGIYEVVRISGGEGFAADAIDDATKPADVSAQFWLNADKTAIVCAYGYAPGEVAYIGGNGGNLSDSDNWTTGVVPTSGNVTFDFAAATTLVVGDTFRADTITIPSSSAVITIGEGALRIAGSLTNACKLAIAQGASLTVAGDLVVGDGQGTFLYSNEGTVTVTGNAVCANTTTATTTKQYEVVTENTQPIQAAGLLYNIVQSGRIYWRLESHSTGAGAWVVGANGLNFINPENRNSTRFYAQNSPVTLYSSANWTLVNTGLSNTSNGDLEVYDNSSLTIDTTDYNDGTTPRTVTLEGRIKADGNVTIAGSGTVVVATTDNPSGLTDTTVASGKTLYVTDTATLKVNAGKKILGAGTISLSSGTTLAFASTSREFATPDIVPVMLPDEGAATIRIDGKRLVSGKHVLCPLASVPENLSSHVIVTGTALDGRRYKVETEEVTENEKTVINLVINIYSDGFRVIVR